MNWFDTKEGILGSLGNLSRFHDLLRERRDFRQSRKFGDLTEYLVKGRWLLPQHGGIFYTNVQEGYKDIPWFTSAISPVVPVKAFWEAFPGLTMTSYWVRIPHETDRCQHCLGGWTLEDAHLATRVDPGEPIAHLECHNLYRRVQSRRTFETLFRQAGFPLFHLEEIPNGYWASDPEPWYLCHIRGHKIKIGRRKRVTHIECSAEGLNFNVLFATEDVTKGDHYIHAWTDEKVVEYLEKIYPLLGVKPGYTQT